VPRPNDFPNDIETLKRLLAERDASLEEARGELRSHRLEIERLKLQLARLRRMQFGRSSEQFNEQIAQLEFALEELEAAEAAQPIPTSKRAASHDKPVRRALPAHLPRENLVHEALPSDRPCTCPD
jgi:transposase